MSKGREYVGETVTDMVSYALDTATYNIPGGDYGLEFESDREMAEVLRELSENGYEFDGGEGMTEPDLTENPGISLPFGNLKIPGNIEEGVSAVINNSPLRMESIAPGILIEDDKLYATSPSHYRNLEEAAEVLEE